MNNQKGFTLVEVIVSLALIGIISVVFLSAFNMSLTKIVRSGNRSQAVIDARDDFFNNPNFLYSSNIEIVLPTPSGEVKYFISGSYAESEMTIGAGSQTEATVKVQTFLPGLVSD